MTLAELHRNFKIELDKSSISSYPSFLPEEIDYWLNTAILRFIKTRYSGLNIHKKGFDQNQKRIDDIRRLVTSKSSLVVKFKSGIEYESGSYAYFNNKYYRATAKHTATDLSLFTLDGSDENCMVVGLPEDYMFAVGESTTIYSDDLCWPKVSGIPKRKRTDIIEATTETIDTILDNSLSEYHLHSNRAKPVRLNSGSNILLFTDGKYIIDKYVLEYIKMPERLDYYKYPEYNQANVIGVGDKFKMNGIHYVSNYIKNSGDAVDMTKISEVKLDFMAEHTWDEITVLAVRLALENITEPRYQTYSQESQVIE